MKYLLLISFHFVADDVPHSGRQKTATSQNIIDAVHDMFIGDKRLKVVQKAEDVSLSEERLCHILKNELVFRKLMAKTQSNSIVY